MNVKIFNPAEYNLPLFQQDPNSKAQGHSKHAATELVSSGPHGIQIQQHAHPRPGSKSLHIWGNFTRKASQMSWLKVLTKTSLKLLHRRKAELLKLH